MSFFLGNIYIITYLIKQNINQLHIRTLCDVLISFSSEFVVRSKHAGPILLIYITELWLITATEPIFQNDTIQSNPIYGIGVLNRVHCLLYHAYFVKRIVFSMQCVCRMNLVRIIQPCDFASYISIKWYTWKFKKALAGITIDCRFLLTVLHRQETHLFLPNVWVALLLFPVQRIPFVFIWTRASKYILKSTKILFFWCFLEMALDILCMCPANERWCYTVTPSLIGWAHTQNVYYKCQGLPDT